MNRKTLWWSIGVVVVAVVVVAAMILGRAPAPETEEVVEIGAVLPLTGNLAFLGQPERHALQMAIDEINEQGGLNGARLEAIIEDSKGVPRDGVAAVNKLISVDGVKHMLVTTTLIVMPTQPVIEAAGGVQFAISMHPDIAAMSPATFRVFPTGKSEAELLAGYLTERSAEIEDVAIISGTVPEMESEVTEYLVPALQSGGIDVVATERFDISQREFRDIISAVKASDPDAVVLIGFGVNLPPLLQEIRQQQLNSAILGGIGFIELSGEDHASLVEGAVFMAPRIIVEGQTMPEWQAFSQRYQERFGISPPYNAAYMYDQVMLLAEAIRLAGSSDPGAVRQTLPGIQGFNGVTGQITVGPDGDTETAVMLATYRNGQIESLD